MCSSSYACKVDQNTRQGISKPCLKAREKLKTDPSTNEAVSVNMKNNPCVSKHVEACYETSDYPAEMIVRALKGKHSYLVGMFEHSLGDSLELRSGEKRGWTDSVPACGGNSGYIRPRAARNSKGRVLISKRYRLVYVIYIGRCKDLNTRILKIGQ